jgi:poly(3-hydroxybutyrate) depolymerase
MRVSEAALKSWSELLGISPDEQPPPEEPTWVTPNTVRIELPAMRLREFANGGGTPTLVVAPFALHGATLVDLAPGHSLVERLLGAGVGPLFLVECKSATKAMRFLTIDSYLADLALAVEEAGGRANLVGLCQGGWLSLMFAARFPQKTAQLALAGSPIDLDAARSPMVTGTRMTAPEIFRGLVDSAEGRMLGRSMQTFWGVAELAPTAIREVLQEEAPSPDLIERFLAWHNWTLDLPGAYYLDVVERLFRNNELCRGSFCALGRRLDLSRVDRPLYLLGARRDEVTPPRQLFALRRYVATPRQQIRAALAPGGHLSLFMGARTLAKEWADIAQWLETPSR